MHVFKGQNEGRGGDGVSGGVGDGVDSEGRRQFARKAGTEFASDLIDLIGPVTMEVFGGLGQGNGETFMSWSDNRFRPDQRTSSLDVRRHLKDGASRAFSPPGFL